MLDSVENKSRSADLNAHKIFNLDASLLKGFILLGYLCQIWSFLSEFIGLNQYLIELSGGFMPPYLASITGNTLAFLLALTIEISTFAAVTYIVNCLYNDYVPFKWSLNKVERANWLKFIIGSGVTFFIILLSITVSKRNIEVQTNTNPPEAKTVDLNPLKNQLAEEVKVIENRYKTDKEALSDAHNERIDNIKILYTHKIAQRTLDISNLESREQRTGKKFTTARNKVNKAINQLREQEMTETMALGRAYEKSLSSLLSKRDEAIATIRKDFTTEKQRITNMNADIIAATTARNNWLSQFLRLYAAYSVVGFLLCRIWVVVSYNTCGIYPRKLQVREVPEEEDKVKLAIRSEEQNEYNRLISEILNSPKSYFSTDTIDMERFDAQVPKRSNVLLEQAKTAGTKTMKRTNQFTIRHIDRNTGEPKYYNLSQVNNFIKSYERRVRESRESGKAETLESRQKTLNYWVCRKGELLGKLIN